jgi:hypothetical protein
MAYDVTICQINSIETPREILATDFPSLGGELPIHGGWGYSREDAVIIDKDDPVVPRDAPFDGVGLEYFFVEKRIYEELIVFQPTDKRYSGIEWKPIEQRLMDTDGRWYDILTFEITALPDKDWNELKAEWEGPSGFNSNGFDIEAHLKKKDDRRIRYIGEYWFDITSFFNHQ